MGRDDQAQRPDALGAGIGILTFLGGIALLVVTFSLAYGMFSVPPESAIGGGQAKSLDLSRMGESLVWILGRVLLLLVMCIAGSLIAGRGLRLYASSRAPGQAAAKEKESREPVVERG